MGYLWAVKTFGPWVLVLLLVGGLLFMRGSLISANADAAAAQKAVAELAAINTANAATIEEQKAAAALNDQVQTGLKAKLLQLQTTAATKRGAVTKAIANDPQSKTWADLPVPDELRGAIN